jgi:hypothetical protein
MIEITPATTSQRHPLPQLVVRRRRRRSPNDAPGAYREHGRQEKYDRIADSGRPLATLYPSTLSSIAIPIARRPTPATLKSP